MLTDHVDFEQENEGYPISNGRSRAIVWNYFEKIIGDDGLPKTRCIKCNRVYSNTPNSGTSTMRRHLPKCFPVPLTQFSPIDAYPLTKIARSSDESLNEVRTTKKLKSVMEDSLQCKTERELQEFIWRNKRNIPLLEAKLPDKAMAVKETLKCYEDELDRRANLLHKKPSPQSETGKVVIKVETNDQSVARNGNFDGNIAEEESAGRLQIVGRNEDENQKTSPQSETRKLVIKVEMDDQSVAGNENFDGNIAEEENAGRLQIVERHEDENLAANQQSTISIYPENICAELKKVSSLLSMITSPHGFYTSKNNPLEEKAENAKKSLIELLNKDFNSIVGSPDEQNVKSCIQILLKNLDKLPIFQGCVIKNLNTEFESACQNWTTWRNDIHANIAFEVQQGEKIEVLQEWQEKDMEIESRIAEVDADIVRLKAELREKELIREGLVKQKAFMFDQSKLSIEEAKKVLEEMVCLKLQSDVALDNMKDVANKWERMREKFCSDLLT